MEMDQSFTDQDRDQDATYPDPNLKIENDLYLNGNWKGKGKQRGSLTGDQAQIESEASEDSTFGRLAIGEGVLHTWSGKPALLVIDT